MESLEKISNRYADGIPLRDFINEKKAYKDGAMAVISFVEDILNRDISELQKVLEIHNAMKALKGEDVVELPDIKEVPLDPEIGKIIEDHFFELL